MADTPEIAAVRRTRWAAVVPLVLVWTVAAVPVVLWLVHERDPELAVRVGQVGTAWLLRLLLVTTGLVLLTLLVWPPAAAGVRLAFARMRRLLTSDRAPLMRALAELQHFESAARHLEVGRLALQLDETERAATHLHRSLELDGEVAGAHHQFGLVLLRAGHTETAQQHFLAAERLDPGHAFGDALLHAGRTAFRRGQHEQAAQLLRDHQARHGGGRRSHLWLGDALAAVGDDAGARAAWQVAAAPVTSALTAEENWCRALARVRLWRRGGGR
jgi:tetratricopeptide (TPR) repeat protein